MQAKELRSWIEDLDDDDEVSIEVTFPEVNDWSMLSYAIAARPDGEYDGAGLTLSVSVYTADFDYGQPLARLKEVVAALPEL